jgi:hypothetical protein
MKIAITGHTSGIGKALFNILENRGHAMTGLSRRTGHNIRTIPKIAALVEPCGYAQTELLYDVWQKWRNVTGKSIWCISTMMTQQPVDPPIPGQEEIAISQYRTQKRALEETVNQLRAKSGSCRIVIIRPGGVATLDGQEPDDRLCDVDKWANLVIDTMASADAQGMQFTELSLGRSSRVVGI